MLLNRIRFILNVGCKSWTPHKKIVIMKIFSLAVILTTGIIQIGLTQITPESRGFKSYQIKLKSDTIDFFIYNPDKKGLCSWQNHRRKSDQNN